MDDFYDWWNEKGLTKRINALLREEKSTSWWKWILRSVFRAAFLGEWSVANTVTTIVIVIIGASCVFLFRRIVALFDHMKKKR